MKKKRMNKLKQLLEEAKRRTILWAFFILALAYLLSLTSNSVWVNIPIAAVLLIVVRSLSLELEIRKRVPPPTVPPHLSHLLKNQISINDPHIRSPTISSSWRRKIDSPLVEAAVDDFTRRIVKEFVTDTWYAALSPDRDVPEQICLLINDIFGELGQRIKRINLISLLTRDLVELLQNQLELFRQTKASVRMFETLSSEDRDEKLKMTLQRKNQLHPALISADYEYKVLHQLMGGMVAIILRPQDVQCSVVRGLARELLACAVLRPVMNIANPGFINKNIEKAVVAARERSQAINAGINGAPSNSASESFQNVSNVGELYDQNRITYNTKAPPKTGPGLDTFAQNKQTDRAQSTDAGRTRVIENADDQSTRSQIRKNESDKALGKRNMAAPVTVSTRTAETSLNQSSLEKIDGRLVLKDRSPKLEYQKTNSAKDSLRPSMSGSSIPSRDHRQPLEPSNVNKRKTNEQSHGNYGVGDSISGSHQTLSSPAIHGLQEFNEQTITDVDSNGLKHRRTRSTSGGSDVWRKSDQTVLNQETNLDYWNSKVSDWLNEPLGMNGQSVTHSAASKLNCWVVGAHLEKEASKPFVVYSIAVTDADNNTWFVERRFRNFEQLHRKLRDLPQYNLQLPPKRFLSSSVDDSFVRDRSILLDKYLKDLLSIPSIAELHEVWDFLSVTSKNYAYSKAPSVITTLAGNVDDAMDDMLRQLKGVSDGLLKRVGGPPSLTAVEESHILMRDGRKLVSRRITQTERDKLDMYSDEEYSGSAAVVEEDSASDNDVQDSMQSSGFTQQRKRIDPVGSDGFSVEESMVGSEVPDEDNPVPPEWMPTKLTVPLLTLVESVFQLQDRDWIRRQVFWIVKQILQLGMGDAVDDWLITQVHRLREEDVVASAIRKLQEILWPGGIFITKARKNEDAVDNAGGKAAKDASQKNRDQSAFFESQLEATRCASVVHEVLVDGAPAPLVTFIGKQQYTRCAKDLYYFLQSAVFLKQLMYSILEMLLMAIFPEMTQYIINIRR